MMKHKNKINSFILTKMFRSSLFTDIRFPDGNLYGDTAVLYKLFEKAHRVSNNTYSGYYYFIRKSSTSFLKFTPKKLDLIHNVEEMKNYLSNRFPELKNPIASCVVCDNLLAYLQIPQSWKYRKYRRLAKNNIRKLRFQVITDYEANPYLRLALGISYFSFQFIYKV